MNIIIDREIEDELEQHFDFDLNELSYEIIKEGLVLENIHENVEVSILLVDNEQIQELNSKHRKKDTPTDVLSFPLLTEFDNLHEDEIIYLGDIVISVERAKEQADEYGHSFKREVGFLIAHSILHLLGYDHMTEEDEKCMIAKQEEILINIGLTRDLA